MATDEATIEETGTSPVVAAIVSFIIPGVGHYIGGLKRRGLYWLVGFIVYIFIGLVLSIVGIGLLLLLATPLLQLASAADAYLQLS